MNFEQAQAHNEKITEQIKKLQGEYVTKLHVLVVERLERGGRNVIEDFQTEYVKANSTDIYYKDYRSQYTDTKKFFVIVEPVENVKRKVQVALPTRTDTDREPPSGMKTPEGIDPFAET